jgi:hypothetical protein
MRSLTIAAEDGMGPVWEHGPPVDVTRLPITEPLERSLVEFEDLPGVDLAAAQPYLAAAARAVHSGIAGYRLLAAVKG